MSCGPFGKWGDWLIPNKLFGLDMTSACKAHDASYANPEGFTKKQVDEQFYIDLLEDVVNKRQRAVAFVYYWAVSRGHLAWWLCRLKDKLS